MKFVSCPFKNVLSHFGIEKLKLPKIELVRYEENGNEYLKQTKTINYHQLMHETWIESVMLIRKNENQ